MAVNQDVQVRALLGQWVVMRSLDSEARLWIARYLDREISLAEFNRWLLPVAWATGEPDSPDSRLMHRSELWLAEYTNGHRTEDEVRSLLADLVRYNSYGA